jgi:homoserine dehydrogenase
LKVGLAGLGTVGAAVARELSVKSELLAERSGRSIEVVAVSARDKNKDRGISLEGIEWFENAVALAESPDVDVVAELIGGSDGIAFDVVKTALERGRHVVTANKALVALHGVEIASIADEKGVALNYEAAVAGGIPVIKALREGLVVNRISRVFGILNGTCNYILTNMEATKRPFTDVLKEAQDLGYAEADPTFDVDGIDAAHKLSILAALAFGARVDFDGVYCEGIRRIAPVDFEYAAQFGYRIKLLAIAENSEDGVIQRVHPCIVPINTPIADVNGVSNAVIAEGDAVGQTVYEGPGAGDGPTASAVIADIVDIARGLIQPAFMRPASRLAPLQRGDLSQRVGAFYLRLGVLDRPGVIAKVTQVLAEQEISIGSFVQRGVTEDGAVNVVIMTHTTTEAAFGRALSAIESLSEVVEKPCKIRVEDF